MFKNLLTTAAAVLLCVNVYSQSDRCTQSYFLKNNNPDLNIMISIRGNDTTYSLFFAYKTNGSRIVSHTDFIGDNSKKNILNVLNMITEMKPGENILFGKNDAEISDGFEVICGNHIDKCRLQKYNAIRKANGSELYVFFKPADVIELIELMH
jgi:hypothetical protein